MLSGNSCVTDVAFKSTSCCVYTPLVSIIVLNYNGKNVLEACLDSISKSAYSPFEVLVVDNASKDGSDQITLPDHRYRLLKNKRNLGFCGGNNVGIRVANGEFVVLLNNDTEVDPDWLSQLVKTALTSAADFCAPKILLDDKETINSTGLEIHIAGFGLLRGLGKIDAGQYDNSIHLLGAHGACIFASRKAIEKVGVLDEAFFAFNDDTDWSWRALLKGLKIIYVPSAVVYHKWGHSWGSKNPEKFRLVERNRLIMILTNYSGRSIILLFPILVITELATMAYCLQSRSLISAKINSYADLLMLRQYLRDRRNSIQDNRQISDRLIVKKFQIRFEQSYLVKHVNLLNSLYKFIWNLVSSAL